MILHAHNVSIHYGKHLAVSGVMLVPAKCLRCLVPTARASHH